MERHRAEYIPPLRYGWLTPLYDPLLRCTLRESTFKRCLVEQARLESGHRVLDLGCGTATLTVLIKRAQPQAEVVGLDADPKVLRIGSARTARAGLQIALVQGMAFALPYADGAFDRVLSSLMFHHLTRENKCRTLREIFRVLRPGGELHVADWGKPQNGLMRAAFILVQVLDGFETTADSLRGVLPELLANAGFAEARQLACYATPFGTLCLYSAQKPLAAASRPHSELSRRNGFGS